MVYVSLSVSDLESTIHFFTKVLRIFDSMAESRLICNSGVELIIDAYEIGSERHNEIFGINTHSPSNISIHHGESIKIKIIDHLEELNIDYELHGNIAGQFLKIKDPTGNKFSIWAHHGGIL